MSVSPLNKTPSSPHVILSKLAKQLYAQVVKNQNIAIMVIAILKKIPPTTFTQSPYPFTDIDTLDDQQLRIHICLSQSNIYEAQCALLSHWEKFKVYLEKKNGKEKHILKVNQVIDRLRRILNNFSPVPELIYRSEIERSYLPTSI